MRARTIREGSVGLLILLGLGLAGGLILWLKGFNPANRSYQATVDFANTGGIQPGAPVRYRGVTVGRVTRVQPAIGSVEVDIEISSADLLIPRNVLIESNQSGFIGEIFCRLAYLEGPIPSYRIPSAEPPIEVPPLLIATSASLTCATFCCCASIISIASRRSSKKVSKTVNSRTPSTKNWR